MLMAVLDNELALSGYVRPEWILQNEYHERSKEFDVVLKFGPSTDMNAVVNKLYHEMGPPAARYTDVLQDRERVHFDPKAEWLVMEGDVAAFRCEHPAVYCALWNGVTLLKYDILTPSENTA